MLDNLRLNNFPSGHNVNQYDYTPFVLSTCQRTIVLSYGYRYPTVENGTKSDIFEAEEAYRFLLTTICGLKSKMVGENEIVGQFKTAYKNYVSQKNIDTNLLIILEKLFRDAKEVRTKYLAGLCQKTYASIARRHICAKHKGTEVLILGSGQLAEDLINQFKKKAKVFISARNLNKVQSLATQHNIEIIEWNNVKTYTKFPFIVNTIGFEGKLLDQEFFDSWAKNNDDKLFIDLGSPSCIQTNFTMANGFMDLNKVFEEGAVKESKKREQIKKATLAMDGIVMRRSLLLEKKLNNSKLYGGKIKYV